MPGVMALLVILSLLGTAMYAYSMQSVQSVRFASDGKKAEYLAQAGVEAAVYAFQAAVDSNKQEAISFRQAASNKNNTVSSNRVWLVYNKTKKIYGKCNKTVNCIDETGKNG